MPKFPTFPTLYDDCKTICISDLQQWGYLEPHTWQNSNLTWSRNGNKTGSISIRINTIDDPYLELDYTWCKKTPINYRVQLVRVPSNIGKGFVWYFVCPRTGKRCRKLFLVDTYFLHRSAFVGCMYEKQTYSRNKRFMNRQFDLMFGVDNAYQKIYTKYFKPSYAGKPTKRYLELLRKIKLGGQISEEKLLRLI